MRSIGLTLTTLIFLTNFLFAQNQSGTNKIDSLKSLLKTAREDSDKVNSLNALSEKLWRTGDYEQAKKYADEELQLSEKISYQKGKARSYNDLGVIAGYRGDFQEAIKNHLAALKIGEEIGDKHDVANSYNNIAQVYYKQGNYPVALKNYYAALKIREETGNRQDIADSYNNIAIIYSERGNYEDALKNHFASLKIKQEIGNKRGIIASYVNIGTIYNSQGNYTEALKNNFAAVKMAEEIGDKKDIASAYANIGTNYIAQGKYKEALKSLVSSLKIKDEMGDKDDIAAWYINIGAVYTLLKNFEEAGKYLDKALSIAKETGSKEYIRESYINLSELDSAVGNYKQSLEHYKLFTAYKDSMLNESNSRLVDEMKAKYETEKKDKEIEVKEVEIKRQKVSQYVAFSFAALIMLLAIGFLNSMRIRNKAARLVQANELRQKISRDLHDEIGSGLTTISMICEQAEIKSESKEDNITVPELSESVKSQSRSVSEKLRELVWATNPENDSLDVLLSYMRNYVPKYFENSSVAFSLDLPEEVPVHNLAPDVARNLIFVLKEALNNCIKHSHATEIEILFRVNSNKNFTFKISDNGKGIDYNTMPVQHSGLANMRKRIESIKGKFEMASGIGKGTSIEINGSLT